MDKKDFNRDANEKAVEATQLPLLTSSQQSLALQQKLRQEAKYAKIIFRFKVFKTLTLIGVWICMVRNIAIASC